MRISIRSLLILLVLGAGVAAAQERIPDGHNDYLVTLETDYGNMILLLFDETPMHKENFVDLAMAGVYNGVTFHRVIENFMIQSGDPNTSNQQRQYNRNIIPTHVPAEINPKFRHRRGSLGAARYGGEQNPMKNSSPSQFYIVRHDRAAPHLDGDYTVFGQVMSGLEVIDSIAVRPVDERDRPVEHVRINRVRVDVVARSEVMKFYNYSYD
jgi:cyclophilin family peptidyl-prolyl cis-trans isomerase